MLLMISPNWLWKALAKTGYFRVEPRNAGVESGGESIGEDHDLFSGRKK
jgi:hypothetical protein